MNGTGPMRWRADVGSFSPSISTALSMSSVGVSAPDGSTVYPVANRSRPGMIERAAWTNEPSSKWPDVQFHGNCHQSRTPQEWSRCPAQSTAIVSSPTVTVPVIHDEIS